MRRMNHRRRRNPDGGVVGLSNSRLIPLIGGGAVGALGSRLIPENISFLSQYNTGWQGYGLNIATGVALSWAMKKFWSQDAFVGGLVGTGVAVILRYMSDNSAASPALSGDSTMNLAYYTSDRFPYPQGTDGPYKRFPGTPYLNTGGPFGQPTAATAVQAGQAAAIVATGGAKAPASMSGGWRGAARY
jgi:hypothetical protein